MAPIGLNRYQNTEIREIGIRSSKSHKTSNHNHNTKRPQQGKRSSWVDIDSRSISPSTSVKSSHSAKSHLSIHSEIGDSGVSSERDSPSPHQASSESDNDSHVSNDSLHGHPIMILKSRNQKMKIKPPIPGSILRQICERANIFEKRRQRQAKSDPANILMLRGLVIRGRTTPSNRIHHTSSFSSTSSLLSSASLFSSTTSLILEEEDADDERSLGARTSMSCDNDLDSIITTVSNVCGLYEHKERNAGAAFAGIRDIFSPRQQSTIRSHKGTVRGVRNRVRAGIATFTSDQRIRKVS